MMVICLVVGSLRRGPMAKRYRAVVLDDHEGVRDFIVEALRAKDFDVRGYAEAEALLSGAFEDVPIVEQPDLVVVDLQLSPNRMQGIDLVAELADKDVSSEILVISGHLGSAEMTEAVMMGAGAALPKPFEDFRIAIRKMEALAETGKRRRLYKVGGGSRHMDSDRLERPVFLSYTSKDKRLANGIRRNLEFRNIPVWYAPTTIQGGDIWLERVEEGLKKATIFAPLVTAAYLESAQCFGELIGFQSRFESSGKPELLILPLLCVSARDVANNQNFGPILRDYHSVDISNRFIDALTLVLGRVQNWLAQSSVAGAKGKGSSDI